MQCPECRFDNPEGARFCAGCGRALAALCAACGAELVAGARFCHACGAAAAGVATATAAAGAPTAPARSNLPDPPGFEPPALDGAAPHERRQVTILFADLVGSTQLGETLDPEDLAAVVDGAFAVMTGAVIEAGGTVGRLMGDGLLAFFGAPVAHEDDPLRAVRAGLAIRDGIAAHGAALDATGGPALRCRVGLDTGLVVAGQVGGEVHGEYTTLGDAANTAARIQSAAAPGEVWLSAETALLVERAVALEALPPVALKGKAAPVRAYRVVGPAPAVGADARGLAGIDVPLIGREVEMAQLVALWDEVLATRRAAWVTLVGDAGIGKSRLTRAALEAIAARDAPTVLAARALDPEADAYRLFRALLTGRYAPSGGAGVPDDGSAAAERARLAAGVAEDLRGASAVDPDRAGDDLARLLYGGAPADDDPGALAERGLRALEALVAALATRGPLVLVLEDLHWADDASLAAVPRLVDALGEAPALVLTNARPGLLVREPLWGEGEAAHRQLTLSSLTPSATARLVAALLGVVEGALPEAVVGLFAERGEGNPFFLEELARMLLARGVVARDEGGWRVDEAALAAAALPTTLLGMLQARLDALAPDERRLAQRASVFGRTFWMGGVAALGLDAAATGPALERLRGGGFLAERARSTLPGERELIFRHALLRDVAYETLLKRDRPRLHAAAAEWLAARAGDRYAELAGQLGDHCAAAGRAAEAAGHYVAAGERERAAFANARALAYYDRALERLAEEDVAGRTAALRGRELVLDLLGDRERQAADLAALDALAGATDGPAASYVHFRRSWLALRRGRDEEAEAEAAAALAAAGDDPRARGDALVNLGYAERRLGRLEAAERHFLEALALREAAGDDHGAAAALVGAAMAARHRGDAAMARERLERTLAIYTRLAFPSGQAAASTNLAVLLAGEGDVAAAAPHFERALAFSRAAGDRYGQATALSNLGWLAKERGDLVAAETHLRAALGLLRTLRNPADRADTQAELAAVLEAAGRADEAAALRGEG